MEKMQTDPLCNDDNGELPPPKDNEEELNKGTSEKKDISSDQENVGIEEGDLAGLIENESFGSCNSLNHSENSDVWNGSDSEDENDESGHKNDNIVTENVAENENTEETPETTENINNAKDTLIDEIVDNDNNGDQSESSNDKNDELQKNSDNEEKEDEENIKKTETENEEVKNVEEDSQKEQDEEKSKEEEKEEEEKGEEVKNDENKEEVKNDENREEVKNDENKEEEVKNDENREEVKNDENKEEEVKNDENKEKEEKIEENKEKEEKIEESREKKGEETEGKNSKNEDGKSNNADNDCEVDLDESMEVELDPSLLCDISMDIEESPVITNAEPAPTDGSSSPLLYEPVFSTYVDEVTGAEISFNLTPEEQELRKITFGDGKTPIKMTRLHCTACNVHLGSALQGQSNRFVHPLLKVLICKECYHFYTSGEFDKDEDGSELYCRWCGQGGQVLCCSKCEFVFCKKCIRNNFGRRKLAQIRDSDEWNCFRCDPTQLQALRVACAEFFEYVRQEVSRASTLNDPTFWSNDYSPCCHPGAKIDTEPSERKSTESKKSRKKSLKDIDPDFNPIAPVLLPEKKKREITTPMKPIQLLPQVGASINEINKTSNNNVTGPAKSIFRPILPNTLSTNVLRVGNTSFTIPTRPKVQTISKQPILRTVPTGGLRTITQPTQVRPTTTQPSFQLASSSSHFTQHEWFEKTVVSAAKVNSHLSYTLSQLNKQQAQASRVEELAIVHNKLQEILSSSINSLIQVRKSLRTDFIAGIKNVKFPPKLRQTGQAVTTAPTGLISRGGIPTPITTLQPISTFTTTTTLASTPSKKIIKKNNNKNNNNNKPEDIIFIAPTKKISANSPIPSTSKGILNESMPRLKVRSLNDLQNVSSDCIIIPDDPLEKTDDSSLPVAVEDKKEENKEIKIKENDENKMEKIIKDGMKNEQTTEDTQNKKINKGDENNEKENEKDTTKENEESEDKGNVEKKNEENVDKRNVENGINEKTTDKGNEMIEPNKESVIEKSNEDIGPKENIATESGTSKDEKKETKNKQRSKSIENKDKKSKPNEEEIIEDTEIKKSTENKENKIKEKQQSIKRERTKDENSDDGGPKAKRKKSDLTSFTFNLKDVPPPELKRMLSVKVHLKKLDNLGTITNGH